MLRGWQDVLPLQECKLGLPCYCVSGVLMFCRNVQAVPHAVLLEAKPLAR